MNKFNVAGFVFIMHELSRAKLSFTMQEQFGDSTLKPEGPGAELMGKVLNEYSSMIPEDMAVCVAAIEAAKVQWEDALLNISRAAQIASRLEFDLVEGTKDREFLWIGGRQAGVDGSR